MKKKSFSGNFLGSKRSIRGIFPVTPDLAFSSLYLCFQEAIRRNVQAGSTATVGVIVDGQILVGNVGDSKALLCSQKHQLTTQGSFSKIKPNLTKITIAFHIVSTQNNYKVGFLFLE